MNIESVLKKIDGLYSEGGIPEKNINEFEKELELKFASDYRQYLSLFGCVTFEGHEMTGASSIPRLNVVKVTKENKMYEPNIPNDLYVIEEANIDGIIIWQSGEGKIYATTPGRKPELICDSLVEYYAECNK